jgi:general secretion pathway protein G
MRAWQPDGRLAYHAVMKQDVSDWGWVAYRALWRARVQHLFARGRAPSRPHGTLGGGRTSHGPPRSLGLTLLELLITVALIGLLMAIAVPSYQGYQERVRIATAKKDILDISLKLERHLLVRNAYPATLADIGETRLDPWGAPYQYLSMEGANVGQKRKDKSLHPLNSDYDLYSMGPDGRSQTPLTARASRDDIIRANNGAFIGVAEDY